MPRDRRDPARDPAYLLDMLEAARALESFVRGRTYEEFCSDLLLRSAVERQIEIIGEAARHVSDETRATRPDIPWRAIIAQRHRLAHEYGLIREETIWRVATFHAPQLARSLVAMLPPAP